MTKRVRLPFVYAQLIAIWKVTLEDVAAGRCVGDCLYVTSGTCVNVAGRMLCPLREPPLVLVIANESQDDVAGVSVD